MNQISHSVNTIDFSALLNSPAETLSFRAFGTEREDLNIDFAEPDTPALVTQILTLCAVGQKSDWLADFFWNLSVGKRHECLLRLAAGDESEGLSFPFKCAFCCRELELELTFDEIYEQQNQADCRTNIEIDIGAERLMLRKPLGIDQKKWQTFDFSNVRAASRQIIGSLSVFDQEFADFDDEIIKLIDEAMDEADPLINFNCRAGCGECGEINEFETDLCEYSLNELRRQQSRLVYSVHRLAEYYHWSESEIFAVPFWRRLQYLKFIGEGKS